MRWFTSTLRDSLYGLLGHASTPTESRLFSGIEDIREAMLELIGDDGPRRFPQVTRRIRYATDIQALWYLRGDLMAILAALHGEAEARERVRAISTMFRGLLPPSLTGRSRALAR